MNSNSKDLELESVFEQAEENERLKGEIKGLQDQLQ